MKVVNGADMLLRISGYRCMVRIFQFQKMAAQPVIQRLSDRAKQADELIGQLRSQLDLLKKNAVIAACQAEEEKLKRENDDLKKEINNLKNELIAAEVRNGVKQVPLPNGQKVTGQNNVDVPKGNNLSGAAQTAEKPIEKLQQKKKEKKQANKGDNKGKQQQPAAPERPVDVSMLNMRIGHIVNVKKHPDADSLYVEEVDVGEERNRTIISGLVNHIPLEQMEDRIAIFLCNLKPAKMRGIMSEGMIMCGSSPEKVEIIEPPPGSIKGERVIVVGYPGEAEPLLNPKKKIFEQIAPDLKINEAGVATYKDAFFKVETRDGNCTVPSMKNCIIK